MALSDLTTSSVDPKSREDGCLCGINARFLYRRGVLTNWSLQNFRLTEFQQAFLIMMFSLRRLSILVQELFDISGG